MILHRSYCSRINTLNTREEIQTYSDASAAQKTRNNFHKIRKWFCHCDIAQDHNPYPKVPSKYKLRSSTRSMMPRMFDSRPMGMLTNAALWFSLVLKQTKIHSEFRISEMLSCYCTQIIAREVSSKEYLLVFRVNLYS